MAKYIEREAIYKTIAKNVEVFDGTGSVIKGQCLEYILTSEPADVVEVVHGHNETSMHPVDEFLCSVCGFCCVDYTETKYNEDGDYEYSCECEFDYCPKCGAKMDEKKGD